MTIQRRRAYDFHTVLGLSEQFVRYNRSRLIVGILFVLFIMLCAVSFLSMKRTADAAKKKRMKAYAWMFAVLAVAAVIAFGIITFVFPPIESLPAY